MIAFHGIVAPSGDARARPVSPPGEVMLLTVETGVVATLRGFGNAWPLAWSPDSRWLLVGSLDDVPAGSVEIRAVDIATGASYLLDLPSGVSGHFAWSPDGRWLVTPVGNSAVLPQATRGASGASGPVGLYVVDVEQLSRLP